MPAEQRTCQNCKQDFTIEPEDFDFYRKIDVPPPKLCPECRLQRRMSYRNERSLYKRTCNLCKQQAITVYPEDAPFPVYCTKCWYSDNWDAADHGLDYDLSQPFFEQYARLSLAVPHLGMPSPSNNQNSEYTSWVDECKNCYLVFGSSKCEDVFYSELLYDCKNSFDSTNCNNLELSYQCVNSKNCYRSLWCVKSANCSDSLFCLDCKNCDHCFLSYNLRNKNYCIGNEQYSPEDWERKVAAIRSSQAAMAKALEDFRAMAAERAVHRFANNYKTLNSSGDNLIETKNAFHCFDSSKIEDCRYMTYGDYIRDCMDCYATVENSELCYEVFSTRVTAQGAFMVGSWDSGLDLKYSQYIVGGAHCFGCMGLKKKSYCILNKQYSKEDYEALLPKIIESMKQSGEFGEFFPIALSAFAYNETIANDHFPLSREETLQRGYRWRDDVGGTFGKGTINNQDIPDDISKVADSILEQTLTCSMCDRNYRLVRDELNFYRTLKVPVPRQCPNCRYRERLGFCNPRKLWRRGCQCAVTPGHAHSSGQCPNQFETSYAPERPEIIYCEQCYQAEVA